VEKEWCRVLIIFLLSDDVCQHEEGIGEEGKKKKGKNEEDEEGSMEGVAFRSFSTDTKPRTSIRFSSKPALLFLYFLISSFSVYLFSLLPNQPINDAVRDHDALLPETLLVQARSRSLGPRCSRLPDGRPRFGVVAGTRDRKQKTKLFLSLFSSPRQCISFLFRSQASSKSQSH